jgi:hypothetical protein
MRGFPALWLALALTLLAVSGCQSKAEDDSADGPVSTAEDDEFAAAPEDLEGPAEDPADDPAPDAESASETDVPKGTAPDDPAEVPGAEEDRPERKAASRRARKKLAGGEPGPKPIELLVREVTPDFRHITLNGGADAGVFKGLVFELVLKRTKLPPGTSTTYHYKELFLGRAKVVAIEENTCTAEVLHAHTINPVRPGDTAIASPLP